MNLTTPLAFITFDSGNVYRVGHEERRNNDKARVYESDEKGWNCFDSFTIQENETVYDIEDIVYTATRIIQAQREQGRTVTEIDRVSYPN